MPYQKLFYLILVLSTTFAHCTRHVFVYNQSDCRDYRQKIITLNEITLDIQALTDSDVKKKLIVPYDEKRFLDIAAKFYNNLEETPRINLNPFIDIVQEIRNPSPFCSKKIDRRGYLDTLIHCHEKGHSSNEKTKTAPMIPDHQEGHLVLKSSYNNESVAIKKGNNLNEGIGATRKQYILFKIPTEYQRPLLEIILPQLFGGEKLMLRNKSRSSGHALIPPPQKPKKCLPL